MENLTYYPFRRNRYFNGKLLTAADFEQEQRYLNDKRRLVNRWMFGFGVAAGLEVIQVDDYSISLEMGLAFDQSGREIFVEAPVIRKLSLLDGYEEATMEEGSESLYLCIEYSQSEEEPVYNIGSDAIHGREETSHSKYQEGYHLYVTDEAPKAEGEPPSFEKQPAYIGRRAEEISRDTGRSGICLAKVYLVKAGPFYMIQQIEKQPFRQYVMDFPLVSGLLEDLGKRVSHLDEWLLNSIKGKQENSGATPRRAREEWQFAEGTVAVPVPENGKLGQPFFSRELVHGLGPGNVQILLRVIDGNDAYGGADGIFMEAEVSAKAASRLSRKDGTFVIGLKLLAPVEEKEITVGWTAIRSRSKNEFQELEARMFVEPGIANLKVREETVFHTVCVNMEDCRVSFRVVDEDGGFVDGNGTYRAPNRPGIYQVEVQSLAQPGVRACAYIVVKEE